MPRRRRRRRARRSLPPPRSPRRGTLRLALILTALVGVNLYVFLWRGGTSIPDVMERAAVAGDFSAAGATGATGAEELLPELGPLEEEGVVASGAWIAGEVQSGDSMGRILRREGLEPPVADRLIRALTPHLDFKQIRPGQGYKLHIDPAGEPTVFEYQLTPTTKVLATRSDTEESGYRAQKIDTDTEVVVHEVGGTIDSSLFMSIKNGGEDTKLVSFFVDVFAYDLNFYIDTHQGDSYRMLVEKEYLNGEFLGYGRILAAEYSGKAGTYRAFWWKPPGAERGKYYDEKGRSIEKTFLKTPLKYARVSSKFNPSRMHPILHKRRGHWGVDYAAPTGTPVWAAASGRITYRGRRGGAGKCIIIRHKSGHTTIYMHLSKFRRGFRVGSRVRQKDVIGYVGMTGLATGPHLHFGVKKNGRYIDPLKMKMSRGPGVPKRHMDAFRAHTSAYVERLAAVSVAPDASGTATIPMLPVLPPPSLPE